MRSHAARVLGTRAQQPQAQTPQAQQAIEPGIPVMDESGQVVARTYTAQQLDQLLEQRLSDILGKELAPLKQERDQRLAAEKARQTTEQAEKAANTLYAQAEKWQGFKDHEQDICEVFKANEGWTLQDAYLDVLHRVILPKLTQQQQSKVLDDLKTKAAAVALNPAAPSAPAPKRPQNFYEAFGVER